MSAGSKITPEEKAKLPEDPRKLLVELLSGKYPELRPVFDPVKGCRYPEVEEVLGDSEEVSSLLEKLTAEGLLARKLFGKHPTCPHCHSPNVGTLALCPRCKSYDIEKKILLEHFKCGHIDTEDRYRTEGKLVCPKCKTPLDPAGKDSRKVGIWFVCHACKRKFDEPYSPHQCRSCGRQFTIRDAELKECYSYTLGGTAEVRKVVGVISSVRSFLESSNYKVESPGIVKGSSGVDHRFDILAVRGENEKLVVEIVQEKETVGEQPIITMFAKVYDLGRISSVLIALPRLSHTASQLAAMYKITVIEAGDSEEAVTKLKTILQKA
ncbi:hypothetical protein [Candidatus Hecatella orcuttiae]|uniref:TackOD1 domain-containing metal-binding protein n=1 Tax=Candidatus Hecatella orcuttiae TaxID=1935119 RepID=UPI002867E4F0|nr:hypothetical protein [Candidatus Hecatella orcuttiae]